MKSKFFALVGMMAASGVSLAGSIDQSDPFYSFYDTVDGWSKGGLGTGMAITMLLMGGGIGIARNSPMSALSGVASAAFMHWGPQIIKDLMVGGGLF